MIRFFNSKVPNTNDSDFQDFGKSKPEALKQIGRCNILVIGNTGVGKSTLIGTVLQTPVGTSRTEEISKRPYSHSVAPIALYDTPGLEKENKQRKQVKNLIKKFVNEQKKKEPNEHIHVVWYCLNSQTTRESDIDQKWISSLAKELPVILVITRAYKSGKTEFQSRLQTHLEVRHVIPILAEAEDTNKGTVEPHGLDTLKSKTEELLDEVAQKAISDKVDCLAKKAFIQCLDTCGKLLGFQFVPISLIKSPGVSLLQNWMVNDISKTFGYNFNQDFVKKVCSIGVLCGYDSFIEEALKSLPINQDNIQSIQDVLQNLTTIVSETAVSIPFKDEFLDLINSLANSSLGNVPVIAGITAIATIFSTWVLGCALIEALKVYKSADYKNEELPDLEALLMDNIQAIIQFIQQSLGTTVNPSFAS